MHTPENKDYHQNLHIYRPCRANCCFGCSGFSCAVFALLKGFPMLNKCETFLRDTSNSATNKCWKDAILKAHKSTSDENKRMTIALINVYTQNCENNYHNNHPFYQELNEKLRNNTTERIWRDTEQLLNIALAMLGQKSWPLLYRSCHCTDIKQKDTITNGGFLSTSLELSRLASFLRKDKVLFLIENSPP
ncbi:hypothetical protein MAR_030682, partial [Mya arenaria]